MKAFILAIQLECFVRRGFQLNWASFKFFAVKAITKGYQINPAITQRLGYL